MIGEEFGRKWHERKRNKIKAQRRQMSWNQSVGSKPLEDKNTVREKQGGEVLKCHESRS